MLIAGTSLAETPTVLVTVMVGSLLLTATLRLVATEMGRRATSAPEPSTPA